MCQLPSTGSSMIRATRAPITPAGPGAVTWTASKRPSARASTIAGRLGHPELEARIEGHLDLGGGGEPAVDAAIGADHLDVVAGHAELAQPLDRVADPVDAADRVRDQRDAPRPSAGLSLPFSLPRNAAAGA